MTEQEMQFELMKSQEKVNALRQEVAEMNKEREFLQQVHIQASIAAMQAELSNPANVFMACDDKKAIVTERAVSYADALIEELKRKNDVYAEARRQNAINTAAVCENMTRIQKELQKKGGEQ